MHIVPYFLQSLHCFGLVILPHEAEQANRRKSAEETQQKRKTQEKLDGECGRNPTEAENAGKVGRGVRKKSDKSGKRRKSWTGRAEETQQKRKTSK